VTVSACFGIQAAVSSVIEPARAGFLMRIFLMARPLLNQYSMDFGGEK
jgi:hypothetical protein